MTTAIPPLHLAFQVDDLAAARTFYRETLGCRAGRSSDHRIGFDFHGHQIVAHDAPQETGVRAANAGAGHAVPVPHFGLVLDMEAWPHLAERLTAAGTDFAIAPYIRVEDKPGAQATMFFTDPGGNAIEMKAFANPAALFEK